MITVISICDRGVIMQTLASRLHRKYDEPVRSTTMEKGDIVRIDDKVYRVVAINVISRTYGAVEIELEIIAT